MYNAKRKFRMSCLLILNKWIISGSELFYVYSSSSSAMSVSSTLSLKGNVTYQMKFIIKKQKEKLSWVIWLEMSFRLGENSPIVLDWCSGAFSFRASHGVSLFLQLANLFFCL